MTRMIAKVVDDILIAGSREASSRFYSELSAKFKVGSHVTSAKMKFNGLTIEQKPHFDITFNIRKYFDSILPIPHTRSRRKMANDNCTPLELNHIRSLAEQLNFLGHGVLPPASLVASNLQQFTSDLRVDHLRQANSALHLLKKLNPSLT